MAGTNGQESGQFPRGTPLTGHNIQGHSLNVRLVREVPEDVLRNSVTHFGTRGMFGKPVRRTSQHDHDNVRRKKWRSAHSLKSKDKSRSKDHLDEDNEPGRGSQAISEDSAVAPALLAPVSSASGFATMTGNRTPSPLHGSIPPPSHGIPTPSFAPPSTPTRRVSRFPSIHREYSLSEAAAEGMLPTSVYPHSATGTAQGHDGNPTPTTDVVVLTHVFPSSQRDAPLVQDRTSTDSGSRSVPSASGSASRERRGFVGPPPSTHPAYPTSTSLATAPTRNPLRNHTPAHVSPMPSEEHIMAVVEYYTTPPAALYVEGAVASTSGLVDTSTIAREAARPMAPELRRAPVAIKTVSMSDLHRGARVPIGANVGNSASSSRSDAAANEVYYTHEGYLGASNSVAGLPQNAQGRTHLSPARGQGQGNDSAYAHAPTRSSTYPPATARLPPSHSG